MPLLVMGAILVAGLGIRIAMAILNEFPTVDGVFYLDQSYEMIIRQRVPFSCFPPGWPALVAAPYAFMDKSDPLNLLRAGQAANVFFGVLAPLLAFRVMHPYLGRGLALLGMALLMFSPQFIIYSKNDLSEMSFTCTLLAAWLLLERKRRVAAGLMFGFAYLIRPEALLAAGGLGLMLWLRERKPPWRLALPMVAVMIPYLVFIWVRTGAFDLTSKTVAVSLSLDAHPGWHYLGLIFSNLGEFLPKLGGLIGLPLVLLALWGMIRRPGRWLWLLAPVLPVPFIINPMDVRFWLPYLPVFILAAGLGAADLIARPWLTVRWRQAVLLAVILIGFGLAARDDVYFIRRNREAFYGLRDAGAWLRPQVKHDTLIAAYKPYTSFWAGCRFIKYPPDMDAAGLVAWARNNGAEYMIVNVKVAHHLAKGLDPLLTSPLHPRLADKITLVELIEYDLVEHNTAIYRINDPQP
jgi:4-amino-4-deoxy-L-arabinose transferase-like glycosyltransferase